MKKKKIACFLKDLLRNFNNQIHNINDAKLAIHLKNLNNMQTTTLISPINTKLLSLFKYEDDELIKMG